MFTVIICDEHIIEDCQKKYRAYFSPFLSNDDVAFCPWNTAADSLDEALPKLKTLIRYKKEWRAIIVNDGSTWGPESVNKRNPFDYVNSQKKRLQFSSFEEILEYRRSEALLAEKALTNPLTKLAIWLCGSPILQMPGVCYEPVREQMDCVSDAEAYDGMLKSCGLSSSDVEADWSRANQFRVLARSFELKGELFVPPYSVLALAERAMLLNDELDELAWKEHTEFDYSRFYIDNLYPEKLRYILMDVPYRRGRRSETRYFNFLTALLLLAANDCPQGVLRSNRVYRLDPQIDPERVSELCGTYTSKLYATMQRIEDVSQKLKERGSQPLDRDTAELCFESPVTVPVEAVTAEDREALEAKSSGIGLARDCPVEESDYWDRQYRTIHKAFLRFLREPRRAVKTATKESLRANDHIEDERALRLNEFQREDVRYMLEEEERSMIATPTPGLFDSAAYTDRMKEADREIRRGIAQRMTRRKTLLVCLIAVAAYFIGFLPLLFGKLNSFQSFSFSLTVTGIVLGVFMVIGLGALFVLRQRLVNRFKHFNYVMSGILQEIEDGLHVFSEYLSHACNVMREFSVINYSESSAERIQYILANHKRVISDKIVEVNELFSVYVDPNDVQMPDEVSPYAYDFTLLKDYAYELPYADVEREIVFLQEGNNVQVPIDFVESVLLAREELYD